MPRADLLLKLVRAGSQGDQQLFRRTIEAIIAEERSKHHHVLADRLAESLSASVAQNQNNTNEQVKALVHEIKPYRSIDDLILNTATYETCKELIVEHQRRDLLHSYNLTPRHRILLAGPPGNGKTTLAEALAYELMCPLYVLRYEEIIGSFLGETSNRLKRVFDFARLRHCVLFFDEFDAVGKERGDTHETGEIKRVVNSLLLQIDGLPSHTVVVAATNHPELLDKAVWRRFQLRLSLPNPGKTQVKYFSARFSESFKNNFGQPLPCSLDQLSDHLQGLSFAELEEFKADVVRQFVLGLPKPNLKKIIAERLNQWQAKFTL